MTSAERARGGLLDGLIASVMVLAVLYAIAYL